MNSKVELYDVVALAQDMPERKLVRGQVGTAVEELAPGVFEIEFCDGKGATYAMTAIHEDRLIVLHCEPSAA